MTIQRGIYTIENRVTGCRYVGSAGNIRRRWSQHRSSLGNGTHHSPYLQRAWNKYGEESFVFALVEECDPSNCLIREQWWMDRVRPEYNVLPVAGSFLGHRLTEATRRKMSIARTGKTFSVAHKARIAAALRGHGATVETRAKISAAKTGKASWNKGKKGGTSWNKGRKASAETRAKISAAKIGNIYWKGKKHSTESRDKISVACMGRAPWNKGKKGVQIAWNKGTKLSTEHSANMGFAHRGMKRSMETRAKMSAAHIARIARMGFEECSHKARLAACTRWHSDRPKIDRLCAECAAKATRIVPNSPH